MIQKGIVFNIQRFSIHDGPGIRTTVFLKGCPLKCLWCSNPESKHINPQLMVRNIKCIGCASCVSVCPENAILFSENKKRQINWHLCTHCFACVEACLSGSLTAIGEQMTPEEVVEVVEKDTLFYQNSGGGATISGGEALVQHEFLKTLLLLLKQKKIHIALDTTGHAPESVIENIIPLVDLVLFDIKHLDTVRHKEATGIGNELILKNLRYVAPQVRTWIRIPLIAGYNDGIEHIKELAKTASALKVEKISFLPYHEGGISKISQIGQKDPGFSADPPTDVYLEKLIEIMRHSNIDVSVSS